MASDARNRRLAEFLGLLSFGLSLMLLISLGTYNPSDPAPFFKAGTTGPARNFIGPIGAFLAELLVPQLFGFAALLLPLILGWVGWSLFWCRPFDAPYTKGAGILVMLLSTTALLAMAVGAVPFGGESLRAGGAAGELLASLLIDSFNRTGAYIVLATSLFVSIILATQFSFAAALSLLGGVLAARARHAAAAWVRFREARRKEKMRREVIKKHTQKEKEAEPLDESVPRVRRTHVTLGPEDEDTPAASPAPPVPAEARAAAPAQKAIAFTPAPQEDTAEARLKKGAAPAPPTKRGSYVLPPTTILDELKADVATDKVRLFEKARTLQGKCGEFGVLGSVVEIHPGPVVTTYEFKPDAGIKYSKIVALADDLALALEAESIRVDRMSGRGTVGIEIPNEVREMISLREILETDLFRKASGRLTLALGKTVGGEPHTTDLAAMPHLLIAGATGTGKSVGLNCMIASILYKATPDEVRLILIDPKRLELGVYEDIPHLLAPVVTDPKIAANVLKWAVTEMEKRIRKLASEGVRNIDQYNNVVRAERPAPGPGEEEARPLHYIVIVIDELADLMMVSSHDVEESITPLAQMAR